MEAALNGVKYDEFLEELKTLNLFFPGHFMLLLSSICRQIPELQNAILTKQTADVFPYKCEKPLPEGSGLSAGIHRLSRFSYVNYRINNELPAIAIIPIIVITLKIKTYGYFIFKRLKTPCFSMHFSQSQFLHETAIL